MQAIFENYDLSDCESDEPSDQPISKNFNEAQSSINRWDTLSSRTGVSWKRISDTINRGRATAENIFSERSGPTSYFQRDVQSKSTFSAFCLFIDEPMLRQIQKYTTSMDKLMTKIFLWNFAN